MRGSDTPRILASLGILAEETKEEKLVQCYNTQKQMILTSLSEIVDTVLTCTEEGSYSEAVKNLDLFYASKANLESLNDEHLNL